MTAAEIAPAAVARHRVDRIKVGVEAVWHLIVESYQARDWEALGYATWDEMCTREFGTSRLRLPREERAETIGSLRDAGLSLRAIGAATGYDERTVRRTLASTPAANAAPADEVTVEELAETSNEIDLRVGDIGSEPYPTFDCDRCGATWHVDRNEGDGLCRECHDAQVADSVAQYTDREDSPVEDEPPALKPIIGLDGKSYKPRRPAGTKQQRKSLPDAAADAGWQIRKAAERIEQIVLDDRFGRNKEQVSTALRGHLLFVTDAVAAALEQLSTPGV